MNKLARLGADLGGVARICGPRIATNWALRLVGRMREISQRHDMQPADRAMGEGPFTVSLGGQDRSFRIAGPTAFSGIREMYVRDVYCRRLWTTTGPDEVVVDLGANMGNFSAMVLARDPAIRVIAVEPSRSLNAQFIQSLGLNQGFLERVQLIRAFIGGRGRLQDHIATTNSNYTDCEWMTEQELASGEPAFSGSAS